MVSKLCSDYRHTKPGETLDLGIQVQIYGY